jgi:5-methylcytosine-specific restriction endonuclease McrA
VSYCSNCQNNKNKRTITNIPDKSRYKKRARLPDEKQNNTI